MLFSVEQAFVGRNEKRAPLKMPAREAKRIAPCKGIEDSLVSGFHVVDSGFQVLDFRFQSLVGFRIPGVVFRIPKPRIPNSTSKNFMDSGYHKQVFPGFSNLDSLTWGDKEAVRFCAFEKYWKTDWIHPPANTLKVYKFGRFFLIIVQLASLLLIIYRKGTDGGLVAQRF